ncbi:MAG: T9SS type A sorting domain-containing protein, partial [Bacteroidota bacterium]
IGNGLHSYHIRFRDGAGRWSAAASEFFFKASDVVQVAGYEYWFDEAYDQRVYQSVTPATSITLLDSVLLQAVGNGIHRFHIRFVNTYGEWSITSSQFFVMRGFNNKVNAYRYWFDGDITSLQEGEFPESRSPQFFLEQAQTAHLKAGSHVLHMQFRDLLGQWSAVQTDTFTSYVRPVLTRIFPQEGEQESWQHIRLFGNGFRTGVSVRLKQGGSVILTLPDSLIESIDYEVLTCRLPLQGFSTGSYDVELEIPGDTTLLLPGAFQVTDPSTNNCWARIETPGELNMGQWTPASIRVGNRNARDAANVPVWIGLPAGVEIEFEQELQSPQDGLLSYGTLSQAVSTDTLLREPLSLKLHGLLIPMVPGRNFREIPIRIKSTQSGSPNVFAIVNSPLDSSFLASNVCLGDSAQQEKVRTYFSNLSHTAPVSLLHAWAGAWQYSGLGTAAEATEFARRQQTALYGEAACQAHLAPKEIYQTTLSVSAGMSDAISLRGPDGHTSSRYQQATQPLYVQITARFPAGSATPIRELVVKDSLNASTVDWSSFSLGDLYWGDSVLVRGKRLQYLTAYLDFRPTEDNFLQMRTSVDTVSGVIEWTFRSMDTRNLGPQTVASNGFLKSASAELNMGYSYFPKETAAGNLLQHQATATFDTTRLENTGPWAVSIDTIPPSSHILPLDSVQCSPDFTLSWTGSDAQSGIWRYDVYASTNGGAYKLIGYHLSDTTLTFRGAYDSTYSFYTRAIDQAFNQEAAPVAWDAQTQVRFQPIAGFQQQQGCDVSTIELSDTTLNLPAGIRYTWILSGDTLLTGAGEKDWNYTFSDTGLYTVSTIIEYAECVDSLNTSISIDTLPARPIVAINGNERLCKGNSISLQAPSGAAYMWSTGETASAIQVDSSAQITLMVTDSSGCQSIPSDTVRIVQVLPPTKPILTSGDTAFCFGDSLLISTQDTAFRYLWSDGDTTARRFINSTRSLSVRVESADGCISPASDVTTFTELPQLAQPVVSTQNTTPCLGDTTALTADSSASYQWFMNGTLLAGVGIRSLNATQTGMYQVQHINSKGCRSSLSQPVIIITDTLPGKPNISIINGTSRFCQGDSVQLQAPTSSAYLWSTGETTASVWVNQTAQISLQIENSNGCQSAASDPLSLVAVALPLKPVIVPGDTSFCNGDSLIVGVQAPQASYLWSDGITLGSRVIRASSSLSIQVLNADGCISPVSDVVTFTELPSMPQPAITATDTTLCQGDSSVLTTSAAAGYNWYRNGVLTNISSPTWTIFQSGMYEVQHIDNLGCLSPLSPAKVIRASSNQARPVIIYSDTVFCQGDSAQLSGPVGYPKYQWSKNGTPVIDSTASLWVSAGGAYQLVVTDSSGCSSQLSPPVNMTERILPVKPTLIASDSIFCDGDSVLITSSGGYRVQWRFPNGQTLQDSLQRWADEAGVYQVRTVDSFGCSSPWSDTLQVQLRPATPKPTITASGRVICVGDSITLTSSPADGYFWYNPNGLLSISQSLNVGQAGSYWVQVEQQGLCVSPPSDLFHVSASPIPARPVISPADTTICPGDSVVFTTGNYAGYLWSNGDTTRSILVKDEGSYFVKVNDSSGCTSQLSLYRSLFIQPLAKDVLVQSRVEFCPGDSAVLVAKSGFTSYIWSDGLVGPKRTEYATGTFSIDVIDSLGCPTSQADIGRAVQVNPPRKPVIREITPGILEANVVALTYEWFLNGQLIIGQDSQRLPISQPGTYTVIAISAACGSDTSNGFEVAANSLVNNTLDIGFDVVPNPNNGTFQIRFTSEILHEVTLRLFDQQGKIVWQDQMEKGMLQQYAITALPEGLYLFQVEQDGKYASRKILVRR